MLVGGWAGREGPAGQVVCKQMAKPALPGVSLLGSPAVGIKCNKT